MVNETEGNIRVFCKDALDIAYTITRVIKLEQTAMQRYGWDYNLHYLQLWHYSFRVPNASFSSLPEYEWAGYSFYADNWEESWGVLLGYERSGCPPVTEQDWTTYSDSSWAFR